MHISCLRKTLLTFTHDHSKNALDYQLRPVWSANPGYAYDFSLNLSQVCDGLFTRFHSRRVETSEISVEFDGFVSDSDSRSFIYLKEGNEAGYWADTEIHDVRIQLWKPTFLSGGVPPPVVTQSVPLLVWVQPTRVPGEPDNRELLEDFPQRLGGQAEYLAHYVDVGTGPPLCSLHE